MSEQKVPNKNNSNKEKKAAQYNANWVNLRLNEKTQTKGKQGKKKKKFYNCIPSRSARISW